MSVGKRTRFFRIQSFAFIFLSHCKGKGARSSASFFFLFYIQILGGLFHTWLVRFPSDFSLLLLHLPTPFHQKEEEEEEEEKSFSKGWLDFFWLPLLFPLCAMPVPMGVGSMFNIKASPPSTSRVETNVQETHKHKNCHLVHSLSSPNCNKSNAIESSKKKRGQRASTKLNAWRFAHLLSLSLSNSSKKVVHLNQEAILQAAESLQKISFCKEKKTVFRSLQLE